MILPDKIASIFGERRETVPRGRQEGPRRPERATKPLGKGYQGKGGQMTGRGRSGEKLAPEVPSALKKVPTKKEAITEFDSMEDWLLSMILVALMHANPGLSPEEAIKNGKEWVRRLYMPRTDYLWRRQTTRMHRHGIRAEASKIRREMFKLI